MNIWKHAAVVLVDHTEMCTMKTSCYMLIQLQTIGEIEQGIANK